MNLELKPFQEDAVTALLDHLDSARFEAGRGRPQALSLASPTGSGKTVIMTRVIELVLDGDGDYSGDPDATFLWLTDQPELNEQTRAKMLQTSGILNSSQLTVIGAGFDQETLTPGRVYFLNTQKLGRSSNLVREGDRNYTLWETLTNTIVQRPTQFYLVIDEAHRGMQQGTEAEEANSIMQKFIKGSDGEIPVVPMVVAVSATIERFNEVVSQTPHVKRPVEVPIEDVRESGLLKEVINIFHPEETQPSDFTMLREAACSFIDYSSRWHQYEYAEAEDLVEPIMLVQVQDGTRHSVSATPLEEVVDALREEIGFPGDGWLAHAFQEGAAINVGDTEIRYLAPSAIERDPEVRVVLFKTSLNLGWDCPRAEVMMSFRSARDVTLIAQLVGRMVRAPLARPIESDEHLNTVALYLPHYDRAGLRTVIDKLQAGDPSTLPPTRVRTGNTTRTLRRAVGSDAWFQLLSGLPTYVIPRAKKTSQVRRLGKMASLLSRSGIEPAAPDEAVTMFTDLLLEEYESRKDSEDFQRIIRDSGVLSVRKVEWRYEPEIAREEGLEVEISGENIDDLFTWAGKQMNEGLNVAYWRRRVEAGANDHRRTKLEAYALASNVDVMGRLERAARERVRTLFDEHRVAIGSKPEDVRSAFNEIRALAESSELGALSYPEVIEWTTDGTQARPDHIYQDEDGQFSFNTTSWEVATLAEELGRGDVVAWVRNPDRKPWSLCVPYELSGRERGCYPDFIVIRRAGDGLVADIIDPHLLSFEDAWTRAKGLAKYAARHADAFGRIEMVRVENGSVERLDLMDEAVRGQVLAVSSNDSLRCLFVNLGFITS